MCRKINVIHCQSCDKNISTNNYGKHIKSVKHLDRLIFKDGKKYCKYCDKLVLIKSWYNHKRSLGHCSKAFDGIPPKLKHCELCGITVRKSSWPTHCKSKRHNKKVYLKIQE